MHFKYFYFLNLVTGIWIFILFIIYVSEILKNNAKKELYIRKQVCFFFFQSPHQKLAC